MIYEILEYFNFIHYAVTRQMRSDRSCGNVSVESWSKSILVSLKMSVRFRYKSVESSLTSNPNPIEIVTDWADESRQAKRQTLSLYFSKSRQQNLWSFVAIVVIFVVRLCPTGQFPIALHAFSTVYFSSFAATKMKEARKAMSRNRRNCESFIRSKNKINETKIKRVFAVLVFAFDSFVFLSALSHSFIRRCSGAIARARFSMKQKKKNEKKEKRTHKIIFPTMCWCSALTALAHKSNRNSISAHRKRLQSPHGVLSIETNSIYKLSCAREHKMRFFFKLKNKLHDERNCCSENEKRKKRTPKNEKPNAESNRQTDLQSRKRRHDSFNADTFLCYGFVLVVARLSLPFRSLSVSLSLAESPNECVCVNIKWLQAFSICRRIRPTCQLERWDFYFSLFFLRF